MDAQSMEGLFFCIKYLSLCLLPIITVVSTERSIFLYHLHKEYKHGKIQKVSIPLELKQKYTTAEINQITSKKISEAVLEFTKVLEKEFPKEILTNFYNNINETKIERNIRLIFGAANGIYYGDTNTIEFITIKAIFHELFHLASGVYDEENGVNYCGFHQRHFSKDKKIVDSDVGRGLNEGYTELLTQRYFKSKYRLPKSYVFEPNIASKIEEIVGKEEMTNRYFKADLKGLVDNLKQYSSEEEVSKFLYNLDFVSAHNDDFFMFRNSVMKKSINDIYDFLLQTYINKLKKEVDDGIITINEFIDKSAEYLKSLGKRIKVGDHRYKCLNKNSLTDALKKANIQEEYLKSSSHR
jgi:hypothetical protein